MLAARMADREDIPVPSPAKGRRAVTLPALTVAKIELYKAMRETGTSKAELARRLGWHMPQIDRLINHRHASRLDQLEAAFRVFGREIEVSIRDAA